MPLPRNMRVDTTKDQMGSLLFPERPNQANQMLVPASNVAVYGTSVDHPLSVAGVVAVNRPPEVADRLRPFGASQMPQQHKALRPTHILLHHHHHHHHHLRHQHLDLDLLLFLRRRGSSLGAERAPTV